MHLSSLDNMKKFVDHYLAEKRSEELIIVDLGSQNIGGSYRQFFQEEKWQYIGLDISDGPNVDIVLNDPYKWTEIKTSSVDVFISGQAFEHIEYFWLTIKEISRVLKPGGLCCIIAPSGGEEHRYPVDCWRFLPDGFKALAHYAALEVISSQTKSNDAAEYSDDSATWADTVFIGRKPTQSPITTEVSASDNLKKERTDEHIYEGEIPPSLQKIAEKIIPGSKILELGPATGYFTRFMKEELHCSVDCIEISNTMAEQAERYSARMVVGDLDKVNLTDVFDTESYDYILAADILEHLQRPEKTIKECWPLLKKKGNLLISLPNIAHAAIIGSLLRDNFEYQDEGILDRTHLKFFTERSIIKLLNKNGFTVNEIDAVSKLPEETEFADNYLDFPKPVQDFLLSKPNALTYQFIISATPGETQQQLSSPLPADLEEIAELRRDYKKKTKAKIELLENGLKKAEQIALERLTDIHTLKNSLKTAEGFAIERLASNKELHTALHEAQDIVEQRMKKLKTVGTALKEAQQFVRKREKQLAESERRLHLIQETFLFKALKKLRLFPKLED